MEESISEDEDEEMHPSQLSEIQAKYLKVFESKMKSDLLKRSYKRMYKDDIIGLKDALIVIMPTLDDTPEFGEEEE